MSLTFRSSRIIYYGPHACSNCGVTICKMGAEFGGTAFTYPDIPIYPNTEWHPHVCDPKDVERMIKLDGPEAKPPDYAPAGMQPSHLPGEVLKPTEKKLWRAVILSPAMTHI